MFGVSEQAARKWLQGDSMPETARLAAIAARLGCSAEWLLTGHGPQHATEAHHTTAADASDDRTIAAVVDILRNLPSTYQRDVLDAARTILRKHRDALDRMRNRDHP